MKQWMCICIGACIAISGYANEMVKEYLDRFDNLNYPNSKGVILFTAMPGMGRFELARRLEEELHAIRINYTDVIELFFQYGKDPFSSYIVGAKAIHKFTEDVFKFVEKKQYPNQLFIIDSNLGSILPFFRMRAQHLGFKVFTIKMEALEKDVKLRILKEFKNPDYIEQVYQQTKKEYEAADQCRHDAIFFYSEESFEEKLVYLLERIHKTLSAPPLSQPSMAKYSLKEALYKNHKEDFFKKTLSTDTSATETPDKRDA